MPHRLTVTQVFIPSKTRVGDEVISTSICGRSSSIKSEYLYFANVSTTANNRQWWLSFTKRKFMGKSL